MHEQTADQETIIYHYRNLVGALLGHSWLHHEGSELAIGDFIESDDRAAHILLSIIREQEWARENIE